MSQDPSGDFPGGPVIKNPPANEGDTGSIDPWSRKIPHDAEQLSLGTTATEPVLCNKKCQCSEKRAHSS